MKIYSKIGLIKLDLIIYTFQKLPCLQALFCLDRALSISSASRQLKISRAECLAFLGRYGEAQEVANDMLRLDNMNADAIYVRGLCLYNEDNVDKAFTHFQQVLRLAPDHSKAREVYKVRLTNKIIFWHLSSPIGWMSSTLTYNDSFLCNYRKQNS